MICLHETQKGTTTWEPDVFALLWNRLIYHNGGIQLPDAVLSAHRLLGMKLERPDSHQATADSEM